MTYIFIVFFNVHDAIPWLYQLWRPKGFFQFEIIINVLVVSFRLIEYLCYGSTAIITLPVLWLTLLDVYTRQIAKVDYRAIRVNPFKPEFNIVIFIHYKPRIAVAILDL